MKFFKWLIDIFNYKDDLTNSRIANDKFIEMLRESESKLNDMTQKYNDLFNRFNINVSDFNDLNNKYNQLIRDKKTDADDYNYLLSESKKAVDDYNELISFAKEMEVFINTYISKSSNTFDTMIHEFKKFNDEKRFITISRIYESYEKEYSAFVKLKDDMKRKLKERTDKLETEENNGSQT